MYESLSQDAIDTIHTIEEGVETVHLTATAAAAGVGFMLLLGAFALIRSWRSHADEVVRDLDEKGQRSAWFRDED